MRGPARERPADGAVSMRDAVSAAAALLMMAGVRSPEADARALAAYVLGQDSLVLATAPPADAAFLARYAEVVQRRRRRAPLQHIIGWLAFRHLRLPSEPGTFVVRPETEEVAGAATEEAAAIAEAGREPVVVDLGTGSGAIALAVATEVLQARVHAVELSDAAFAAARRNIDAADAAIGRTIDLRQGDATTAFADLDARVDVVVANPPYIPPDATPTDPEVRDHDPDLALYGGGTDGLAVARGVVAAAARLLRPGGLFVMEHGDAQGPAVREAVAASGAFEPGVTRPDLTGRDRMVVARKRAP